VFTRDQAADFHSVHDAREKADSRVINVSRSAELGTLYCPP
jgi:hypothetical protein